MTLLDARRGRFRYAAKILLAVALVVGFDRLFLFHDAGWTLGAFALAWLAATVAAHPEIRHDRRAFFAACAAVVFAIGLVEQPGLLGWELFTTSMALAVLLPRVGRFGNAVGWTIRLTWMGMAGLIGPLLDARRVQRLHKKTKSRLALKRLTIFILPTAGAALFISLFANANPVLANLLTDIRWPTFDPLKTSVRLVILALVSAAVWATLRPRRLRTRRLPAPSTIKGVVTVSEMSVVLSLIVFNLIFAVENGLDIAFLWSDAPLPAGVTLAQYAHRGAYPLIATALLAGLFVLVFLRPGSPSARRPLIRWLVIAWIVQNLFLVSSSILRTLDYIDAYSLTRLRIAALLWMGLVGIGLVLVCWRLFREKSGAWLINANVAAALIVLAGVSFTDLGAVAAGWNVRHANEIDGTGAALDLDYLARLDSSALVPLIELETRPIHPALRHDVEHLRTLALSALDDRQDDWRSWTWRGARRLNRANAALARNASPPLPAITPVLTYPAAP